MSEWHIRVARSKDADGLQRCMRAAYSVYSERMGDTSLPPLETDYASEIENFPTWVAEAEKKIVGGLTMSFDNSRATLSNIAVSTDFQGFGLGRGLMAFAEAEAKRRGFTKLHLATHELLSENLAMYRHLGWTETKRKDSRVFFEKELS